MPISRTRLETRLGELKLQLEQIRQQYIAITGAISDIDFWLAEEGKGEECPGSNSVASVEPTARHSRNTRQLAQTVKE